MNILAMNSLYYGESLDEYPVYQGDFIMFRF